ncbi:Protein CBG14218 [Caenorhabditis briggsae]|uniref:Uncharacterized protein n=2 Tax=Caenorhabditis briggsae TaxID=6238 RepID=A0AAE8ZPB5_CAEBR|nr:Protein CBG14218 [Caenorhabditis briggsae]ULT81791.1 hypothetical protein L3Y34_011634 [Caenorhabditis briggsae]CAP32818.1 Protein CBG14218 [Caenorhabditis briggsae]
MDETVNSAPDGVQTPETMTLQRKTALKVGRLERQKKIQKKKMQNLKTVQKMHLKRTNINNPSFLNDFTSRFQEEQNSLDLIEENLQKTLKNEGNSDSEIWQPSLLSKEHIYEYEDAPDFLAPEQRDLQKRKRTSRVRFAEYDSEKNRMRLFVKKTNEMDQEATDSPYFDFMDFSLREGSLECQKLDYPLIGRIEKMKKLFARRVKEYKEVIPRRLTEDAYSYNVGWQGNILGRFWYLREEDYTRHQDTRLLNGILDQYTENELAECYQYLAKSSKAAFSRYPQFEGKAASVKGVLILTNWRLFFLDHKCLTNALVQYLPTHAGRGFWKTMTEFVIQLILDATISFHTIIFAFGGAPNFEKSDFTEFFQNLAAYTSTTYEVCWIAQDWLDGLPSNQEDKQNLDDFNNHTKELFDAKNSTRQTNYKWGNINSPGIPPTNMDWLGNANQVRVKTIDLEKLYNCYIRHFVDNCNCYPSSKYFIDNTPIIDDYAYNDSRFPLRLGPADVQDDSRAIQTEELQNEPSY